MALQGPILIVAGTPADGLAQAFTDAGAFPVIVSSWAGSATAAAEVKPSAIVMSEPDGADTETAVALCRQMAKAIPFAPLFVRLRDNAPLTLPDALPIAEAEPAERVIARVTGALRLRALHATVIGRARALKDERNVVADMPDGDPLDDATVLLIGRGRHHPTLSVAVGECMGVIGALSVEAGAGYLNAREIDGVVIGDGLSSSLVETFLALLAGDSRFRDLPVAVLGGGSDIPDLPNFIHARDPLLLVERAVPLIRLRAFETALKRLLQSIEHKGMLDPRTGLLNHEFFGRALDLAIEDSAERGVRLSLARFWFEEQIDRRTSLDAARLISRLVRDMDFACQEGDGSILFAFADTDLRSAHVVARRLASVLKHTMLRTDRERPSVSPSVTLATLQPSDSLQTLLARVKPRPVAAA